MLKWLGQLEIEIDEALLDLGKVCEDFLEVGSLVYFLL